MMYTKSKIPRRNYWKQYRVHKDNGVILSRIRDIANARLEGLGISRPGASQQSRIPRPMVCEAPMGMRVPIWIDLVPNNKKTADFGADPCTHVKSGSRRPLDDGDGRPELPECKMHSRRRSNVLRARAFRTFWSHSGRKYLP